MLFAAIYCISKYFRLVFCRQNFTPDKLLAQDKPVAIISHTASQIPYYNCTSLEIYKHSKLMPFLLSCCIHCMSSYFSYCYMYLEFIEAEALMSISMAASTEMVFKMGWIYKNQTNPAVFYSCIHVMLLCVCIISLKYFGSVFSDEIC